MFHSEYLYVHFHSDPEPEYSETCGVRPLQ